MSRRRLTACRGLTLPASTTGCPERGIHPVATPVYIHGCRLAAGHPGPHACPCGTLYDLITPEPSA